MLLGAAVIIGGLIGSVGVGGVLLVPFLTTVMGLEVRESVAIAMASYVATGLAAILQARFSGDWTELRSYWPLIAATLPGAFLGGLAIAAIPDRVALALLAAFLIITGGWTLMRDALRSDTRQARAGWLVGIFSGFTSALTGTGGPAALMPLLLWRSVPVLAAIALGQIVQLPIALAATAGNLAAGPFDAWTTALVAIGLIPGVVTGRAAAKRLPVTLMTPIVAVLMIATGAMLAARMLF